MWYVCGKMRTAVVIALQWVITYNNKDGVLPHTRFSPLDSSSAPSDGVAGVFLV